VSTDPLRPIKKHNAYTISITAAAGTNLTGAFSPLYITIFHVKTVLQFVILH